MVCEVCEKKAKGRICHGCKIPMEYFYPGEDIDEVLDNRAKLKKIHDDLKKKKRWSKRKCKCKKKY
jgi:hypothetical protein